MGLGWTGAYGAQGAAAALRQLIADRMAAKQQEFQNNRLTAGDARADRQLDLQDENQRLGREASAANQAALQAERDRVDQRAQIDDTRQNFNLMPRGTDVTPIKARLRAAGLQPMTEDQPANLASRVLNGQIGSPQGFKSQGAEQAPTPIGTVASGRDTTGGLLQLPNDVQERTGAQYGQSSPARQERTTKLPSPQERQQDQTNARADAAAERAGVNDADRRRHELKMEALAANKPGATVTIQTVDDQGRPVTRIVPKTAGSEFVKPMSATVGNRVASAQAVFQTGDDIIANLSDPSFKAALGPLLGRAGTLRDFIGNPPPEFSELAGKIESYALANMGVHGMRSTQGAEQIKHLLDQHHTPESLIAAIKGLNAFSQHFIENEGVPLKRGTGAAPAPAASGSGFRVVGSRPAGGP